MTPFEQLLNKCLDLHEQWLDHEQPGGYKLGHYSDHEIVLFNVANTPESITQLRQELDSVGVIYLLQRIDTTPESTNIQLYGITA